MRLAIGPLDDLADDDGVTIGDRERAGALAR